MNDMRKEFEEFLETRFYNGISYSALCDTWQAATAKQADKIAELQAANAKLREAISKNAIKPGFTDMLESWAAIALSSTPAQCLEAIKAEVRKERDILLCKAIIATQEDCNDRRVCDVVELLYTFNNSRPDRPVLPEWAAAIRNSAGKE